LNAEFAKYAGELATSYAPDATWEEFDVAENASLEALAAWIEQHPKNLAGLGRYAQQLIDARQYKRAERVIQNLIELCPNDAGPGSGKAMLANLYRATEDVEQEIAALETLAEYNSDATDAYLRLMELGQMRADWELVAKNADRMLAVNPLVPVPHRFRAQAAEELGDSSAAAAAYRALSLLDPADPARIHYRLAHHLLEQQELDGAMRHALMALEEAPRYRDAHRLLLEIHAAQEPDTTATKTAEESTKEKVSSPPAQRRGESQAEKKGPLSTRAARGRG
jgi:tetratricopeptide (TPR) repeat protein